MNTNDNPRAVMPSPPIIDRSGDVTITALQDEPALLTGVFRIDWPGIALPFFLAATGHPGADRVYTGYIAHPCLFGGSRLPAGGGYYGDMELLMADVIERIKGTISTEPGFGRDSEVR